MDNFAKNFFMGNFTFTIIKPEVVKRGDAGAVLDAIIKGGFRISAMKLVHMSEAQAMAFYAIHKERPFFPGLVSYITSGLIVVAVVEKTNAVEEFRKLIGATDPANATPGTIRKKFGTNIEQNAVHGSDSDENASLESSYFFSLFERF
jgi:nucleoside-diphosphate kinase